MSYLVAPESGDAAATKALDWLDRHHGDAVRAAIDTMLHDGLGERERRALASVDAVTAKRIERNAAEWFLAEGRIMADGKESAASACVLAGCPLEPQERAWIEQLARRPLRLYEVVAAARDGGVSVRDALAALAPVIDIEAHGLELRRNDRVGLRLLETEGRSVPSQAAYVFSPPAGEGVLAQLLEAVSQLGDVPEMQGVLIRYCWLAQYHEAGSGGGSAIDPYATDGCGSGACGCAGARAAQAGKGEDDIERQLAAAFAAKDPPAR